MRLRRFFSIMALALLAVSVNLLAGCRGYVETAHRFPSHPNITVYATFYPVFDFAKKIGGDRVDIKCMVPPGADPHSWEPSPRTLAEVQKAQVLVYNGAGMEPWIDRVLATLDTRSIIVVEATHGLPLLRADAEPTDSHNHSAHHHGQTWDPHVWLDPVLAQGMARNIAAGLAAADPNGRELYEKNCSDLVQKLQELDRSYRSVLAKCQKRDIVVTHQAFGYMCKRYGLNQVALMGVSPESEPTPATMAEIIKFCRANRVTYVFMEKNSNPRLAQAIAAEAGARVLVLDPVGTLTEEQYESGKDYFSIMYANLENLKQALEYKP